MIGTKLTERYGIELPFVSAGMGFIAVPPLAAAVSNAGGLGQLATGAAPPEILRKLISATRTLTGRPFAVNFIIETTAFGPLATDAHLRVCIEERVPAVVFDWAPPPLEWVRMLKEGACDVWLQTSSIATTCGIRLRAGEWVSLVAAARDRAHRCGKRRDRQASRRSCEKESLPGPEMSTTPYDPAKQFHGAQEKQFTQSLLPRLGCV
jgi:Nitronate monooxygenase